MGSVSAATGLAFRPSSVAVVSPGFLLVCCDQVIEEVLLAASPLQPNGPLLQSIGFIPFDWITAAGLANTTAFDPSYFYPVTNVPFGGSLPVMVNFLRAGLDGASFYQVKVDGNLRTDQFNTAKWDGTEYVPAVFGPQMLGGNPGYYPVPSVSDLMLYIQPLPGCYLDSTNLASAQTHTITVEFFDASANPIESATPLTIYVDNNPCSVSLAPAAIGASSATTDCGFLAYNPLTAVDRRRDYRLHGRPARGLRQLVVLADQSRDDDLPPGRAGDLAADAVQRDGGRPCSAPARWPPSRRTSTWRPPPTPAGAAAASTTAPPARRSHWLPRGNPGASRGRHLACSKPEPASTCRTFPLVQHRRAVPFCRPVPPTTRASGGRNRPLGAAPGAATPASTLGQG